MRGLPKWKHFDVQLRCCLDGIVQCCRHLTECHGFKIPGSLLFLFCLHLGWLSLKPFMPLTWDSPRKYAPLESMVKGVSSGGRGKCPSPEAWWATNGLDEKKVLEIRIHGYIKLQSLHFFEKRFPHAMLKYFFMDKVWSYPTGPKKTFKDWLPKTVECKMMWPPTFLSIYMCAADHICLFFLSVLNLVVVWPKTTSFYTNVVKKENVVSNRGTRFSGGSPRFTYFWTCHTKTKRSF